MLTSEQIIGVGHSLAQTGGPKGFFEDHLSGSGKSALRSIANSYRNEGQVEKSVLGYEEDQATGDVRIVLVRPKK